MKILVGVDGSKKADDALKSLSKSGLADLAVEALVISVDEAWTPNPPPSSYEVFGGGLAVETAEIATADAESGISEAHLIAQDAAVWLRANFPKWTVRTETLYGMPTQVITKKADEWKPDLIVVGALGHSAIRRLVLGSVSQSVLRNSDCSVRIGRLNENTKNSGERILIGFDASPGAEKAVEAVAERKWSAGSAVKLMFAEESGIAETAILLSDEELVKYDEEGELTELRLRLAAAVKLLESKGLSVSTLFKTGEPKEMLIAEAILWKADCIFVGARGLNLIKRLLLGSVSSMVAAQAGCSVEIVH